MAALREILDIRLGQKGRKMSVFEATMRLVADEMGQLNETSARPGEENLTASLVGLIVATFPWCVEVFGPDDVPGATCEWSQFKKQGSGPDSESRKGADFALVVKVPDGKVRVAIFQAKHDGAEKIKDGHIKLHHPLSGERSSGVMQTQMGKLFDLGTDMLSRNGEPGAGVKNLGWVHYFAQIKSGLKCVPLGTLGAELKIELESPGAANLYRVPEDATPFHEVLLDALSQDPSCWHEFELDVVNATLPALLELMTAWVGDDERGGAVSPDVSSTEVQPDKEVLMSAVAPSDSALVNKLDPPTSGPSVSRLR